MPDVAAPPDAAPAHQVAALLLALAGGSLDAIAFLALGQVFASVMTGNLVLLGIALERGDEAQATATGIALVGYIAGVLAGSLLTGRGQRAGRRCTTWLLVVLTLLLVAGWLLAGGAPDGRVAEWVLLGLSAVSMGVQSIVSRTLPGGPSTTYFTGTLTGVVADVGRLRHPDVWAVVRLAVLLAGAAVTALLLAQAPRYAVAPVLLGVGAAGVLLLRGDGATS